MNTIVKRFLLLVLALGVAGALMAPPAAAIGSDEPPEDTQTTSDGQTVGVRYGCRVSAGPNYLGLTCPGVKSGVTLEELLCNPAPGQVGPEDLIKKGQHKGCLKVKRCWDDRELTPQEMKSMGYAEEEGFSYWWRYCLDEEFNLEPPYDGPREIETEVYKKPDGEQPVSITRLQEELLSPQAGERSVPRPFAAAAPNPNALVYRDLAFYDWRSIQLEDHAFEVPAGDVFIKAVVTETTVEPLGADGAEAVTCAGPGIKVTLADTPQSRPGACWYRYENSSARQDGNVYHVNMSTHWKIYVLQRGDEGTLSEENLFTEFDKTATTRVPVREVQTVVIY